MKILSIITIAFIGLMSASCATTNAPAGSDILPFHSVAVRDGAIVATLPAAPRWLVQIGAAELRMSRPDESFTLQAGSSLRLVEHHLSYLVTAQLTPTPGLKIESHFNASSFGGTNTVRSYFISAK
jgi:hypothetical protein